MIKPNRTRAMIVMVVDGFIRELAETPLGRALSRGYEANTLRCDNGHTRQ
jgi:hypothetical protein